MKLVLLLMIICLQVRGTAVSQQISISESNAPISKVLQSIRKQSGYTFFYKDELLQKTKPVTIKVKDATLEQVLEKCFEGQPLTYSLLGKTIVIKPREETVGKKAIDRPVSGKVTSESGEPLIGVTVVVKGTTTGASTDVSGNFSLQVPENGATLVFSYIGFATKEVAVGNATTLHVTLSPDAKALEEVVVVGYGTQKKADVTGAIASVNATTISRAATTDAAGALQGQTPGVVVVKNVGKPGSGYSINVRGISSFGGSNSPLFVIDGIPTTSGINDLNPADIEKIDVLKDASATAIYGSRGAKGVVIVTTKRGKAGKTLISYDAYAGVRAPNNLPELMSGPEYVAFRTQQFQAQGRSTDRSNAAFFTAEQWKNIDEGRFTDWPSLILKNGLQMNHNVTASGGDDKTQFSLGAGILREEGNVDPEDFKRYSFRGNVDRQINEKWKAGMSFYLSQNLQHQGSFEALRSAYRMPPMAYPYDSNGNPVLRVYGNDAVTNPLFDQLNDIRENRSLRTFGNLYIQVEPIRHLTLKSTISPSFNTGRTALFVDPQSKEGLGTGGFTRANHGMNEQFIWLWDNQATYEAQFGGKHKLTATAIQSLQKDRYEFNAISVFGLPFRSLWYNVGSATNTETSGRFSGPVVSSGFTKYTLASARARINYSYKDKYLFTASGTWDGSSRLAEANQWGFFPSASVAWRLSEEEFIKDKSAINDLKLRLSYGASGNDRVDPYSTQATLSQSSYYFGSTLAQGYTPGRLANKDLTWETTKEINLGLDFGLLNNRIYGSVDLYNRKIENILLNRNLPAPSGWNAVTANIGKLRNRGIEVGLSTINIQQGKFSWKSDFVFDTNKNEILETANGKRDDVGSNLFIGHPVQVNYDYVFDGIWQLNQETQAARYNQKPGQVRVKDIDDNGVINAADRQIIGKRVPDWTGSVGNTFRYGNVDLFVLAYTRRGEQFSSVYHATFLNFNQNYNQAKADYWTPTNPSQTTHQPGNPGSFVNASYYKETDFIRVSNITLGYTLPGSILQKIKINNLRIYTTATNPFLFSKYKGYDPEWAATNTYGTAVSTASYLFGLNLGF